MAYVYRHIRKDKNQPFYIGIGSDRKFKRANQSGNRRNKIWNDIVSKSDYVVDIIFEEITWEEACEKEKEFIALYGRIDIATGTLCNMTDGGDGAKGAIRTDEFKKNISNIKKGKKISEETRYRMCEAQSKISSRGVVDTTTGVFYKTISEASFSYNIPFSSLSYMLNGKYKNKTNLILI